MAFWDVLYKHYLHCVMAADQQLEQRFVTGQSLTPIYERVIMSSSRSRCRVSSGADPSPLWVSPGGCGARGYVCIWRAPESTRPRSTCTSSSWAWSSTTKLTASPPSASSEVQSHAARLLPANQWRRCRAAVHHPGCNTCPDLGF